MRLRQTLLQVLFAGMLCAPLPVADARAQDACELELILDQNPEGWILLADPDDQVQISGRNDLAQ